MQTELRQIINKWLEGNFPEYIVINGGHTDILLFINYFKLQISANIGEI